MMHRPYPKRRDLSIAIPTAALAAALAAAVANGQMMPGGQAQMPGRPSAGMGRGGEEMAAVPHADKPEAAAKKAFGAGMKSLGKAKQYEDDAARAATADKKSAAMEKVGDAYTKALDQFTEALRNSGDMVDAWNNVGYVHLRLGAYMEAIDDYNHALRLRPDLVEAIQRRGEAYLAVDRLDDAKSAYMDLFNRRPPMAEQLMAGMHAWLERHRADAKGMRVSDVESFAKWLQERDGIAKQTASVQAEPSPRP